MKKFLKRVAILTSISFVFIIIIDASMLLCVDRLTFHTHEINVRLAYDRLKALRDTKKIIIIAGSNGQFSINSKMISEAFHMPVVNTSAHAGIGTRMQFEMYKELLQKGDIVVFCPEYPSYGLSILYGESSLLRIVGAHMPDAYKKITFEQWIYLHKYFGIHCNEVYKHLDRYEIEEPYSAKSVNNYGDIECEREHVDSFTLHHFAGKVDKKLIKYYKYIHAYSRKNGIKLIFLPPTLIQSNYLNQISQIDSIVNCFIQNNIPLQSSPRKYAFPDSLYFDTPYHMTQEGANERTKVLIEDLRRIIGNIENIKKRTNNFKQ